MTDDEGVALPSSHPGWPNDPGATSRQPERDVPLDALIEPGQPWRRTYSLRKGRVPLSNVSVNALVSEDAPISDPATQRLWTVVFIVLVGCLVAAVVAVLVATL